jgi:hypothetical protein
MSSTAPKEYQTLPARRRTILSPKTNSPFSFHFMRRTTSEIEADPINEEIERYQILKITGKMLSAFF